MGHKSASWLMLKNSMVIIFEYELNEENSELWHIFMAHTVYYT